MKCEEAAEWFGIYRDLPDDSADKLAVDLHVRSCKSCEEEFRIWEESALLISEFPFEDAEPEVAPISSERINRNVMERIYTEQSWYMPATRRTYAFSYLFRKRVAGILAALFALFVGGFLYAAIGNGFAGSSAKSEAASAFASSHSYGDSIHLDVPVASLSDPIMLSVSPAVPEYWVVFSIVGMIMTMLILNWFSRVRS